MRAPMSPSRGWVKVGLEQKYTHRRQTTSWKVDEERGFGSWRLPFHSTHNTEGAERRLQLWRPRLVLGAFPPGASVTPPVSLFQVHLRQPPPPPPSRAHWAGRGTQSDLEFPGRARRPDSEQWVCGVEGSQVRERGPGRALQVQRPWGPN